MYYKFSDSGLYLSNNHRNQHRIRWENHAKRGSVHFWLEAETKTRDKEKKMVLFSLKSGIKEDWSQRTWKEITAAVNSYGVDKLISS